MNELSPHERSLLRKVTIEVGAEFSINGVRLKCIERPYVSCASDACAGCYFSQEN